MRKQSAKADNRELAELQAKIIRAFGSDDEVKIKDALDRLHADNPGKWLELHCLFVPRQEAASNTDSFGLDRCENLEELRDNLVATIRSMGMADFIAAALTRAQ
jgi:hypothetical protein